MKLITSAYKVQFPNSDQRALADSYKSSFFNRLLRGMGALSLCAVVSLWFAPAAQAQVCLNYDRPGDYDVGTVLLTTNTFDVSPEGTLAEGIVRDFMPRIYTLLGEPSVYAY